MLNLQEQVHSFQSAYEELKQGRVNYTRIDLASFQSAYEELKLPIVDKNGEWVTFVFRVPMRN